MLNKSGEATARRPALIRSLIVALALVAWLAIGAFGGIAQGNLSSVQENDPAVFLPESAESTRAAELIGEFSTDESLPGLVVLEAAGGASLTPDDLGQAQTFAESIPGFEIGEQTIGEFLTTDQIPAIPSDDGQAVLIPVSLDAAQAGETIGEEEEGISTAVVERLREQVSEEFDPATVQGWVTGPAAVVTDLNSAFAGIDGILLGVALAVVLVILAVVYRSPLLPFAVIVTSVFSLCLAALVIVPLAGNGILLLNGQSQGILSILVIGAATDYSLLLVARYREELTRNEHPAQAMWVAWQATLEPIVASAGTVIAGLLCLLLSDLGSNASLGPVAAIGIIASVFGALTLLPALLLMLGKRSRAMFWPSRPRFVAACTPGDGGRHVSVRRRGLWAGVATFVTKRARVVWVSTAVVLVILAGFAVTFQAAGTTDSDIFLNEAESVAGEAVLSAHFETGSVQPIQVVSPEGVAPQVVAAAEATDGVTSASVASEAPIDGRALVEVLAEDSSESAEVLGTVANLRAAFTGIDGDVLVGGEAAERLDTQATAERDLRTIIPVVLVVIALMLALLLRAVVAPLLLLAANVLSFAATMGLAALVFNHVLDFPGADAMVPLYGFVFLVALGIDYSIFLMTRVREESIQLGTRVGVGKGLAVTGGVITSAGLVLAATFSALWVIPLLFMAQLAFIVAVGVLIDTFIVRSLLVPGLVHDIGRRTWWPWTQPVPQD